MSEAPKLPKALLVEDDPDVHNLLFDQLREAHLDVTGVYTVHEALRLIDDGYRPAVAVIDQSLPDGDGAEVCRRLKQLPEGSEIACLLRSEAANLEKLAREAGADAWLAKTSDLATLRQHVMALLKRDR